MKRYCDSSLACSAGGINEDDLFTKSANSYNDTSSTYVEEYHYTFSGKAIRAIKFEDSILMYLDDVCSILGYPDPGLAVSLYCTGSPHWHVSFSCTGTSSVHRIICPWDAARLAAASSDAELADEFGRWLLAGNISTLGAETTLADISRKLDKLISNGGDVTVRGSHKAAQIGIMEPKAAFCDAFMSSKGNILVRQFAAHVQQALGSLPGFPRNFGQAWMFRWLKDHGYMNGDRYPSKESLDNKWLYVYEGTHYNQDIDKFELHHVTRITPKGQTYFYKKLKEQYCANKLQ